MPSEDRASPMSNLVPQELLSFFVGRRAELEEIARRIADGHRVLAISGQPGTGKTSLARAFAELHKQDFPGGLLFLDASWTTNFAEVLEHAGIKKLSAASLIVLDEANALGATGLTELRRQILDSESTHLIGISRNRSAVLPLTDQVIELIGLSRPELWELMRLRNALAHEHLDEQIVTDLFDVSQGNPLVAQVALEAVLAGTARTWSELFKYLRDFQLTGLVGPYGQSLDQASRDSTQIIVDVSAANEELLRMLGKDPQLVWTLPPRRFEEIVAELLSRQGYEVSLTPASGDGGFDMYAAKKDGLGKFLYLVECKRYVPPHKVGVEIVRALYGVVQAQRATAGAVVTSSYFTAGAEKYRRSLNHQLQLHDYIALQRWLIDLRFATQARAT